MKVTSDCNAPRGNTSRVLPGSAMHPRCDAWRAGYREASRRTRRKGQGVRAVLQVRGSRRHRALLPLPAPRACRRGLACTRDQGVGLDLVTRLRKDPGGHPGHGASGKSRPGHAALRAHEMEAAGRPPRESPGRF